MVTWAQTTDKIIDKGFGDDREGRLVQGAIIHHGAGPDVLDYVANKNNRNSHPTYHIDRQGITSGIVHPSRQPFSTAHDVDNIAITFEIDNASVGGEWPITDESMEALIQVLLDHERQSDRTGFALNLRGVNQREFFIGWHSQYAATACPGPYITKRLDWLVNELNRRRVSSGESATKPVPMPAPTPKPTPAATSPKWAFNRPNKATQRRIQTALKKRKRYSGPEDGVWGVNSIKGIQTTIRNVGYTGPIDGIPGSNTCYYVQVYAAKYGDYTGPIDRILGPNTWAGFALGLERP